MTLTAVGARVGLTPPTLMQRLGNKRGLLLASAARYPVLRSARLTNLVVIGRPVTNTVPRATVPT